MNLGEYSANASAPLIVPALRSCFQRAGFVVRRKTPPFFWHPYVNSERYHPQGSRMEPMKALPLSRSSGVAWLCLPSLTPPTVFFSNCLIWVEPVFCSSRNTSFLLTSMQCLSARRLGCVDVRTGNGETQQPLPAAGDRPILLQRDGVPTRRPGRRRIFSCPRGATPRP